MAELRASDVLPGVRGVCRRAGLGTGSFYTCFVDATDFHVALVRHLSEDDVPHDLSDQARDALVAAADDVASGAVPGTDLASRVAAAAAADMDRLQDVGAASIRAQFLLSGLSHGDDPVAEAIREHYARFYARLSANEQESITSLASALGGVVRPPFTPDSVAMILCAVVEGLLLRTQVDPSVEPTTVIEDTARILLVALLAHPEDPADLDGLVAQTLDRVGRPGGGEPGEGPTA